MYITNKKNHLTYESEIVLSNDEIVEAILMSNLALKELNKATEKFDINIFEVLGMRNLSGLVGEYFAKCVEHISNEKFKSNPHQDGYPDLLDNRTGEMKEYFYSITDNNSQVGIVKELLSPYKYGGIEVKATCGSTPSANKIPKPLIGEQRIPILQKFDWKAHHRQTNNLLGILWDFVGTYPTIVACFYSDDLTEDDWGKIVHPSEGGGRTTSVSIMNAAGIKKMCTNWVAVYDNPMYTAKLANKKWIGHDVSVTINNTYAKNISNNFIGQ